MQQGSPDPAAARQFATEIVGRLQRAGFEALWAGGCVRDELLGRTPADFDVATSARPEQVRELFGRRRTLAVGAAFGVITVLGPPGAGQVEVATFRTDAAYTDGRHPAGVTFCSAREDAARRDFTINGLFFDPFTGVVQDFVGGRDDLAAGIVRAIGVPALRFGEDHLRMLRAVRFAAFFDFVLEEQTRAAIQRMAHLVAGVSPERIAAELRGMVSRRGRGRALELLAETGLAGEVLGEVATCPGQLADRTAIWQRAARVIAALDEPTLPLALAVLCTGHDHGTIPRITTRLRLSNREAKAAAWLHHAVTELGALDLATITGVPRSRIQPLLAHEHAPALADLMRARADCGAGDADAAAWVTAQTVLPRAELDPPPLVNGADLLAAGVPEGRPLGEALARVRSLQLDGVVATREQAIAAAVRGDAPPG